MHPNPAFRKPGLEQNLEFARVRGFGTLSVAAAGQVVAAHVPFVMQGQVAYLHLARSNPVLQHPGPALLMVMGADGYVSPDWYGAPEQVPTWNYVAVHLRGTLEVLEPDALRPHLAELSARFEGPLEKPDWTMDKMDENSILRMERMIVPVRLTVDDVQGTWKLSQNKTKAQRLGAADAIGASHGHERDTLAELMRSPPYQTEG